MTDIFHPKSITPTKQVRLSLQEDHLKWLESKAEEHNVEVSDALSQLLGFGIKAEHGVLLAPSQADLQSFRDHASTKGMTTEEFFLEAAHKLKASHEKAAKKAPKTSSVATL